MKFYVLEVTDQPGHYIGPIDAQGVMIFNTPGEAEDFIWKLDVLVAMVLNVKTVELPDDCYTSEPRTVARPWIEQENELRKMLRRLDSNTSDTGEDGL